MNDPKSIHETAVKEIIDGIEQLKKITTEDILNTKKKGTMSYSSIAKASSNLTMVFPVLCSKNISIESASMVSKAQEKKFVTMLQMLFSSAQIMNSDVTSVQDYINQFHGNIATKVADLDDIFNYTEGVTKGNSYMEAQVMHDMLYNSNYTLPSSVSERSINEMFSVQEQVFTEDLDIETTSKLAKTRNDVSNNIKNTGEYFSKQVLDSDYKKANELQPTMMYINFKVVPKEGGEAVEVNNGIVGVKAKLYPIASDEIINQMISKDRDKNWITNFIRATTREISFFKDFLFAIDKAKIDAMSMSDRKGSSNKMWKVLERRSHGSRLKRAMKESNNMAAITTLVISQDEVEYLRKNYNIDMERLSNVYNLFGSLNLISFVIVDEALEVAKFIYDEQDPAWETVSFTHLEREASDNTYKKVVNLMTKMR